MYVKEKQTKKETVVKGKPGLFLIASGNSLVKLEHLRFTLYMQYMHSQLPKHSAAICLQ